MKEALMSWDDHEENKGGKDSPSKGFKGPWGGGASGRGRRSSEPLKDSHEKKGDVPPNPWAGRSSSSSNNTSGNTIDDLIDRIQERVRKIVSGGGSSGGNFKGSGPKGGWGFVSLLVGGVFVFWLGTGFYRVQEGEVGVVLRFGEMVRTSLPGLQYHLPAPFETVIVQKVAALNTIDGGLRAEKSGDAPESTLILTGDENMVHTNYTVLWKIKDVSDYLFTARNPDETIRVAAESVVREVIGQTTARLALTEGRGQIETRAQEILQKLLDQYKMGIQIVSIQLQNVAPPHQVVDAFNDLQASLVNADQSRNEAEAYRNEIIPRAEGQAAQIINEAEAYSQGVVAKAKGEAMRFDLVSAAYQTNPAITLKWYYLEAMREVLSKTSKIILDEKAGKSILPYLPLNEFKGFPSSSTDKRRGG